MNVQVARLLIGVAALLCLLACSGCATRRDPVDPWVGTNRAVYSFNDSLDRSVGKPIATAYTKNVPEPVRTGIYNFFDNIAYLNVILNDHLQGNFAQGWRNTERMAVNSTVGILGVRDVATEWGRPRHGNDFGTTLGKWGFKRGPYVMLPILGPSTCRDLPGMVVSRVTNPMFWIETPLAVSIPMDATSAVDQRARLQPELDLRDQAAIDPYAFVRDAYIQHREAKVSGTAAAAPSLVGEDIYNEVAPTTDPADSAGSGGHDEAPSTTQPAAQ